LVVVDGVVSHPTVFKTGDEAMNCPRCQTPLDLNPLVWTWFCPGCTLRGVYRTRASCVCGDRAVRGRWCAGCFSEKVLGRIPPGMFDSLYVEERGRSPGQRVGMAKVAMDDTGGGLPWRDTPRKRAPRPEEPGDEPQ
jgi:hypothetical protein